LSCTDDAYLENTDDDDTMMAASSFTNEPMFQDAVSQEPGLSSMSGKIFISVLQQNKPQQKEVITLAMRAYIIGRYAIARIRFGIKGKGKTVLLCGPRVQGECRRPRLVPKSLHLI